MPLVLSVPVTGQFGIQATKHGTIQQNITRHINKITIQTENNLDTRKEDSAI
jgi:hypothetical protein